MDFSSNLINYISSVGDECLVDCATTHTILRNKKYFSNLTLISSNVQTISGPVDLIKGSGRATIVLPNGTKFQINNALYSNKSNRNLLSFKDIRRNGYHIETMHRDGNEYLLITSIIFGQKQILEQMASLSCGLYQTTIRPIESHAIINQKFNDSKAFILWHERLGHPGFSMMRRIVTNSNGHPLTSRQILTFHDFNCAACSQGKLIVRPSFTKVVSDSPAFLERIQGDICGPIHPPTGPFRYFMVLIDASTRWSHVCLLSTRNVAFARLLAQIIRLRAQFPDHPIKTIRLDNAGEFSSQAFLNYCMSIGIDVQYPIAHVHTQNGLAESFIKRLQLIARPLLLKTKLPLSAWGNAIIHAAKLIRLRPTANQGLSPFQLVLGYQPNISHLRVFGCAVYVPIAPTHRPKLGPQRRLGIYVGFQSSSIITYVESLTGEVFTARFADCHFNENVFPPLGGGKPIPEEWRKITWNESSLSHFDPPTKQSELEVQKIIHLQDLANRLPDAFIDSTKVTKSHIPAANIPARIEIPMENLKYSMANEPKPQLKRGRPLGSKDTIPRKRKNVKFNTPEEDAPEEHTNEKGLTNINNELIAPAEASIDQLSHEFVPVHNNEEISMNYIHKGKIWNRNTTLIDDAFSFQVATNIINNDEDQEPQNIDECRRRNDWLKWKEAIQTELKSLAKREVFGPVVQTPKDIKPIGYRWVFVRKRNEQNKIVRYKARLVAQGFSQRPGIDYEETYSPVMDATTFRYLIYLAVSEGLDMRLMDVVTAYLYGSLDTNVYMKIHEGFKLPEVMNSKPQSIYSIKLQRSLYGLKQSGRMWYNRLSHYLLKEGYVNNSICPCVFIKKVATEFAIIAVYVDDLNLIGTPEELMKTVDYIKKEFEMKDLRKTKYCLGLQIEYCSNGVLIHQSTYTEKVLKRFYMDKSHPLSSPMVVRSLEVTKDPFRPKEENEELLGSEVPYLSAIGALMYLANYTRPDIAFSVNLLARYSSAPTKRHWNGIKHVLRYLRGTCDMGLFYSKTLE